MARTALLKAIPATGGGAPERRPARDRPGRAARTARRGRALAPRVPQARRSRGRGGRGRPARIRARSGRALVGAGADRDRRRRDRRTDGRADAGRPRDPSTVYEASQPAAAHASDSPLVPGGDDYFQGQVAEWCGELIDSDHVTIRALARRFHLPLTDLYRYGRTPQRRTASSAATSRVRRSRAPSGPCDDPQAAPRRALSDALEPARARGPRARPALAVRLDRGLRPGRTPLAARPTARRRLRRGVRRRDARPVLAQPALPDRRPAEARLLGLRGRGRAVPHRGRQPAASGAHR